MKIQKTVGKLSRRQAQENENSPVSVKRAASSGVSALKTAAVAILLFSVPGGVGAASIYDNRLDGLQARASFSGDAPSHPHKGWAFCSLYKQDEGALIPLEVTKEVTDEAAKAPRKWFSSARGFYKHVAEAMCPAPLLEKGLKVFEGFERGVQNSDFTPPEKRMQKRQKLNVYPGIGERVKLDDRENFLPVTMENNGVFLRGLSLVSEKLLAQLSSLNCGDVLQSGIDEFAVTDCFSSNSYSVGQREYVGLSPIEKRAVQIQILNGYSLRV